MPGQYEPEPADETGPRRRGRWGLAAAVMVLVLIAVVAGLVNHASSPRQAAPAPTPSPATAPPLSTGHVVLGSGGTGQVDGVPVGFPTTPDGGVAAAVNFAAFAHTNQHLLVDDQRHAIEAAVYSPGFRGQHLDDATAAGLRAQSGLNEQAQPRDAATGGIDWTQQLRFECLGQYGAYRVEHASPTHVQVQTWMPCVFGLTPGSSAAGAQIMWATGNSTVDNEAGQWRWTEFSTQPGPQPAAPTNPVVSRSERARLLGPDWQVPANASEQPGWEGR